MKCITSFLTLAAASSVFVSCGIGKSEDPELPTATNFKADQYAGQWHEVARLPNFFERGVVAARATYGVLPDGKISVFNEGLKSNGKRTSIRGAAIPVGSTPDGDAKLEVRFKRFPAALFAGNYWVLDLNEAHTRAIVGSPNRKFLWLLSKDPASTPSEFEEGVKRMKAHGFAMEQLIVNPKRLE